MAKTVMLFGIGAVGGPALLLLAASEGVDRIVASGRDEDLSVFKMDMAAFSATYQGFSKHFEFRKNDVNDIDATAKLLDEFKPDVVFLTLGIHPPNYIGIIPLPAEARDQLRAAGFGAQLPWHLPLPTKFMQAVKKSGIQTHVVNGSFPDVVNPSLWKHFGFGPTVGMGNSDLVAARLIRHVSQVENVPAHDVVLCLVGSHALQVHGSQAGVPFFLKIQLGDRDITSKYDINWLTQRRNPLSNRSPEERQAARHSIEPFSNYMIAASAVKNIMAMIRDTNQYTQTSSPNGLIGGYPVRLNAQGAEVVLPQELTLEQAIKINEAAEKFDGIEQIKDDGTIVYTDQTYSLMKELGYDCRELTFDELEPRGKELDTLIKKLQNQ